MSTQRDYYELLELKRDATETDIRKAYRRLAMKYHPDVNKSPDAAELFKGINEAYQVLSDPEKKATYDRFGRVDMPGGDMGGFGFGGLDDILNNFFGFGMSRGARNEPARGADLRYDLTLEFEEAVFGCEKSAEIARHEVCPVCNGSGAEPGTQPIRCPQCGGSGEVRQAQRSIFGTFVNVSACPKCGGEGEVVSTPCRECKGNKYVGVTKQIAVQVPAGVDDGTRIQYSGEGEVGERKGPRGNLYVYLRVKPHAFFRRKENDIELDWTLNVAQAALGDEIMIPTLEGEEKIEIPAGIQSDTVIPLRGKGVPHLRRNTRGDLLINVRVVTPRHLTDRQKELFLDLSKTLGKDVKPQDNKSFFEKVKDAFGGKNE
jgi:molecular chaperone DnaJ